MNGPADTNDEGPTWDDLAAELGLEPAATPALPAPPKPAGEIADAPPKKKPAAPPPDEPERAEPFGGHEIHDVRVTEFGREVTSVKDEDDSAGTEETVVEDGPDVFDDEAAPASDESAKEGEGGRRRRRRRRRKKGGPAEAGAGDEASASGESDDGAAEDAGAEADALVGDKEVAPAEIVGEAAPVLDDKEEETIVPALDEELEEESAEPLPEWKVMAWTDLVATLYRPQDR